MVFTVLSKIGVPLRMFFEYVGDSAVRQFSLTAEGLILTPLFFVFVIVIFSLDFCLYVLFSISYFLSSPQFVFYLWNRMPPLTLCQVAQ